MKQINFDFLLILISVQFYSGFSFNYDSYFNSEKNQKIISDRNRFLKFDLFQIPRERRISTKSPFKENINHRKPVFRRPSVRQQNDEYIWDDYGKFWTYKNRFETYPDYFFNDQQIVRNAPCRPPFCYPRRCNQIQCGQSNCVMAPRICPRSSSECGIGQKPVLFGSEIVCVNKASDESCEPNCGERGICIKKKCYCESGYHGETCLILNSELCKQQKQLNCLYGCSFDKTINDFNCVCGNRESEPNCLELRNCGQGCQNGGICIAGKCQCSEGYEGEKCQNEIGLCSFGQMGNKTCEQLCVSDGKNKFQCRCKAGFNLHSDGRSCVKYQCFEIGTAETVGDRCKCKEGWKGTLCDDDIDECSSFNTCHQICLNTPGSYKCSCREGFQLMETGRCTKNCLNKCSRNGDCLNGICYCFSGWHGEDCSLDIDECKYNHGCQQICVNLPGSFMCQCSNGFTLQPDNKTCASLSCTQPCLNNGECVNKTCICKPGFIGSDCGRIDFCHVLTPCMHYCKMQSEKYVCYCKEGYHLSSDGISCLRNCKCVNGNCSEGVCQCNKGYKGIDCSEDVDECIENSHDCQQLCQNTIGSYKCLCINDFQLMSDERSCKRIECPPCVRGTCIEYTCKCPIGFTGIHCEIDVNECDNLTICHHFCKNTHGSFICSCKSGYKLSSDKRSCLPIANTDCQDTGCLNGRCINSKCVCNPGFTGDSCSQDIDECQFKSSCSHICLNQYGSFRCDCYPGFKLSEDQKSCTEECKNCSMEFCKNGQCICRSGYTGYFCNEDVNECLLNHNCAQICVNTVGSYVCNCTKNYILSKDGVSCIKNTCNKCLNGICQADGSCTCNKGYKGKHCDEDVNECKTWRRICQHFCTNTKGSYKCSCKPGFLLSTDQHSCVNVCSFCKNGKCDHNGVCQCKTGWIGDLCDIDMDECLLGTHKCEHNCINTNGSYSCSCNEPFQLSTLDGRSCLEKSENCPVVCKNGGKCVNKQCQCKPGYKGISCEEDINECLLPQSYHKCMGECRNTFGNYECICPPGYVVLDDQKTCTVSAKDTMCKPHCVNGGICRDMKRCFCPVGFQGVDCSIDVDECERYSPCDKNYGICKNNYGSYYCQCAIGYVLMYDGTSCMTIDEAILKPHLRYRGRGTKGLTRIIEN